ncbi:type II toxin-antitoxin system VapC family toxin [Salinirubellus sp. GCM10025818]|uniref:type II toxin-antitoxin system VapC family toxin n=1 Tax=Salinirubellus TaxID=2162630 RepID=UPI0030CC142F
MASTTYVIDTEPLIAFLYEEPGYEVVEDILTRIEAGDVDGAIAEVIASELLYKIARLEGEDGTATSESLQAAERDIRILERRGLAIERAPWRLAGEIKADGGLSLADAYAVALAVDHDATLLVGADEDFDGLPVDVEIERIRDESA